VSARSNAKPFMGVSSLFSKDQVQFSLSANRAALCEYTGIRPLHTKPFASIHEDTEEKPAPSTSSSSEAEGRPHIEKHQGLFYSINRRGNDTNNKRSLFLFNSHSSN